ncbi:MAG: hypothetical protein DI587_03300 [Variovorax paradoxus]|nr:MAG: hypothetical protein DI583_03300 [Variovorax paradoxus]PZQ15725.1 MAG: hypothetical protein DI587_03300 [Variovorax paradoxus]
MIKLQVEQARAEAAAHKAAEKVLMTTGKAWDRKAVLVLRGAARTLREQAREARQIAMAARTPEEIERSRAAVQAAMEAWTEEQRQIAQGRRKAFARRAEAEQARMACQDNTALPVAPNAVTTLVASMAAPVRHIATAPPT